MILFTKGGGLWLEAMADTGCHALGLDWTMDIAARKAVWATGRPAGQYGSRRSARRSRHH